MEDDVDALYGGIYTLIALDVVLDQLDSTGEVGGVLATAGGEVVEHANRMPLFEQPLSEMGADESTAPGDQNFHGC